MQAGLGKSQETVCCLFKALSGKRRLQGLFRPQQLSCRVLSRDESGPVQCIDKKPILAHT